MMHFPWLEADAGPSEYRSQHTLDAHTRRRRRGGRRRATITLLLSLCIILLLAVHPANGFGISDVPENTANRTLTRISIPRTYPLTNKELGKLSKAERVALQREPYSLLAFKTPNLDNAKLKRVVVVLHGLGRDGWLYQDQSNEALYAATRGAKSSPDRTDLRKLKRFETMILSPNFLNEQDAELVERTNELQFDEEDNLSTYDAPPSETTLQWQGNSWALGGDSVGPTTVSVTPGDTAGRTVVAPSVSSFEVMDAIIAQLTDKSVYPALETIIVAGHSLGAQFVQRYALIGAVPSRSVPVHFFIANPGSYAYLTPDRPHADVALADCATSYDSWKYGLGVFDVRYLFDMVRASLDTKSDVTDVRIRYLRDRQVHYLYGLDDTKKHGDRSCEAMSQGDTHLERGRNFVSHINATADALVMNHVHTVDYVSGVGHDGLGMFISRAGIRRLFLPNIDGKESAQGVGYADVDSARYPYRFSGASSNARLSSGLLLAFGCSLVAYLLCA